MLTDIRAIQLVNASGEEIPAFAACEIVNTAVVDTHFVRHTVKKPTQDDLPSACVVFNLNCPIPVPSSDPVEDGVGAGTVDYPAWALYTGTAVTKGEYGTEQDSWSLKQGKGFINWGAGTTYMRVQRTGAFEYDYGDDYYYYYTEYDYGVDYFNYNTYYGYDENCAHNGFQRFVIGIGRISNWLVVTYQTMTIENGSICGVGSGESEFIDICCDDYYETYDTEWPPGLPPQDDCDCAAGGTITATVTYREQTFEIDAVYDDVLSEWFGVGGSYTCPDGPTTLNDIAGVEITCDTEGWHATIIDYTGGTPGPSTSADFECCSDIAGVSEAGVFVGACEGELTITGVDCGGVTGEPSLDCSPCGNGDKVRVDVYDHSATVINGNAPVIFFINLNTATCDFEGDAVLVLETEEGPYVGVHLRVKVKNGGPAVWNEYEVVMIRSHQRFEGAVSIDNVNGQEIAFGVGALQADVNATYGSGFFTVKSSPAVRINIFYPDCVGGGA